MGAVIGAVVLALAAGALWRSPRQGDGPAFVRWITVVAIVASGLAWGLVLYAARLPNGPSQAADLGVIERVLAVREGTNPTAWAYANGELVRLSLPDWRVLARVPARDLIFQTAAWNGRALLVTFVDGRRGRAMIEGWGLLGDAGWIAPPTDTTSAYGSLSAFWDPADRTMVLAELGEYVDRGGAIARPLTLSSVDDKGVRAQVSSTFVHAVESRACRSAGQLWLTGDQPQQACRVADVAGAGGVKACERAADGPSGEPAGGLVCAGVISNVVPGAVLAPEGRLPVIRPPASLVPDSRVALRTSLRLLPAGGTLPDFTWWSPAQDGGVSGLTPDGGVSGLTPDGGVSGLTPDVVHRAGDGWLRFSARSVRGDPGGMAAVSLDSSGQVTRAEATVFDMAQLPAHVFVVGDEVLAVGITPVLARFRLPGLDRVDRPEPLVRVRARLAGMGGSRRLIEGALAVLLAAPPLLLIALLCTSFRAGLAFAKRVALVVIVAAPVLIELVQRMWRL
jgi:hypothetical protein